MRMNIYCVNTEYFKLKKSRIKVLKALITLSLGVVRKVYDYVDNRLGFMKLFIKVCVYVC